MTYVLLIYAAGAASLTAAERRRALDAHRALQAETSSRGALHAVAQLEPRARARTVRLRDDGAHDVVEGAHDVLDGPYVETKEWLVGFYLVDCEDEATAIAHARTLAADRAHAIEVRPVAWRWDP